MVKTDLANQFIDINIIIYIQATDRDCILHMLNERRQVLRALKELERQFPPNFYRIHRSFCVNSDYVMKIGSYVVTLATGETLSVPKMCYMQIWEELIALIEKRTCRKEEYL